MSWEAVTDPVVQGLLGLGREAANADLAAELGGDFAIDATYNFPPKLQLLSGLTLPALTVHRRRTQEKQQTTMHHRHDRLVTFHCAYMLSATAPVDAERRWGLLHRVWESITAAWDAGCHPSVLGGEEVLAPLGIISDLDNASCEEQWAGTDAGLVYPTFTGSFQMLVRQVPDPLEGLAPFIAMHARYHIDRVPTDVDADGSVTDEPGDVEDHITPEQES